MLCPNLKDNKSTMTTQTKKKSICVHISPDQGTHTGTEKVQLLKDLQYFLKSHVAENRIVLTEYKGKHAGDSAYLLQRQNYGKKGLFQCPMKTAHQMIQTIILLINKKFVSEKLEKNVIECTVK